jgi:uncharacterized protein
MKKLTLASSLLFLLSSFAQSKETLELYTGHSNGQYYETGQELCKVLDCSVKNSNGSVENIDEVNNQNDYKIGIVQSDILHDAYYGIGPFEGYNFKNIRTLCSLYEEAYTIVVQADSDIKNFKDLKKKTVNVGKLNSGNYHAVKKLLKLYDMQLSDFKHIGHLSIDSQGEALCKGTIDAAIYSISHPNKLIDSLAKKCSIRILTINDKIIQEHINKEPSYIYTIIKENTYPGNKKEIKTLGTIATLVTSKNVPRKYTCNIIDKINKKKHNLKLIHPSLHDINIHTMVPLHPGAQEFYSKTNKK